jgi:hypothetical protein
MGCFDCFSNTLLFFCEFVFTTILIFSVFYTYKIFGKIIIYHQKMDSINLIEPNVKNYLYDTLQKCHSTRISIYYYVLNIGVLLFIIGVFGFALYYSSKQKMSDYQMQQKLIKDQNYVLSKIRYFKEDKKNMEESKMSSITNLPFTES